MPHSTKFVMSQTEVGSQASKPATKLAILSTSKFCSSGVIQPRVHH